MCAASSCSKPRIGGVMHAVPQVRNIIRHQLSDQRFLDKRTVRQQQLVLNLAARTDTSSYQR
eukprot:9296049-Pyramimonas_sp.AAC.1